MDEQRANIEQPSKATDGVTEDVPVGDDSEDIARDALRQAQYVTQSSRRQGGWGREGRQGRSRGRTRRPSDASTYTGAGPDDRDPQPVGGLLGGLVDERGWQRPLAHARIFADWSGLVGAEISAHCTPVELTNGELRIQAESTAWATQLRLMASSVLAALVRELGPDLVRKVFITGPTGPTWKHGRLAVRGARGPRDTYG